MKSSMVKNIVWASIGSIVLVASISSYMLHGGKKNMLLPVASSNTNTNTQLVQPISDSIQVKKEETKSEVVTKNTVANVYPEGLIHPNCFGGLKIKEGDIIDIKKCNEEFEYDLYEYQRNFIYSRDSSNGDFSGGEIGYEIFGTTTDKIFIRVGFSGGGTGYFSWIGIFEKKGNILKLLDVIPGGDKCNRGIDVASFSISNQNIIFYERNFTQLDLIAEIDQQINIDTDFSKLGDLNSVHNFCDAGGSYSYNLQSKKSVLESVDIGSSNSDFQETNILPKDYSSYECFNYVVTGYLHKGKKVLKGEDFKVFYDTFINTCTK